MSIKILSVVGARPNFMKIAAVCEAIREYNASRENFINRPRSGAHRPALRHQHVGHVL